MVLLRPLILCVAALNILRVGIKDGKGKLREGLLLAVSRDAMVCHVDEEGVGQISGRLGLLNDGVAPQLGVL